MKSAIKVLSLGALIAACASALAETYSVGQENKAFTVEKLQINTGDTVEFVNNDPFFHNVFSLSDTKFFDLGSYPQGESKSVVFDKAGTVEIECAIHPTMTMTVEVKE